MNPNTFGFSTVWALILLSIAVAVRIGDPQFQTAPGILAWLIPVILGTIAIFLSTGDSHKRRKLFLLLALAVFLTTPATFYYYIPIPLIGIMLDGMASGRGFGMISADYWANPQRTVCALCIIFSAGLLTATCISWQILHFTAFLAEEVKAVPKYAMWFVPFPLYVVAFLMQQMLMYMVLLFVRNLGLYPFI